MVGQPETESTLVCPPSLRDQRQARREDLQGSWNPLHKMNAERLTPPDAPESRAPGWRAAEGGRSAERINGT